MAVVPLYLSANTTSQIHTRTGKTTQQDYSQSIEPIHPRFLKRANIDVDICNLLVDIRAGNSFMESKEEFVTNFKPSFIECKEEETLGYPPPLVSQTLELEQALHQRHSGDMMFSPLHQSLSQDIFWEIIRYSTSTYTCDLSSDGANPAAQLHIMVNRVDGIQPGIYRLCHQCKRLHTVELRDLDADTRFMSVATAVNYTNVNMLCFVTANYHTMSFSTGQS